MSTEMIENLIQNLIAISLGTMLFFSFVIAPVIFKVLDANNAGKFVRKIFPHYYLINLIILSIAVLLLFYISSINLDSQESIQPEEKHEKISALVERFIERSHYNHTKIDDDLSSKIFSKYIEDLDEIALTLL